MIAAGGNKRLFKLRKRCFFRKKEEEEDDDEVEEEEEAEPGFFLILLEKPDFKKGLQNSCRWKEVGCKLTRQQEEQEEY